MFQMKTMNKSTMKNQEQQQDSLSCENLNNESSSSSHVQRYINTLAVVEEEQRSILVDESASLPIALCMENTHSCDLITHDTAQRISNIQELNSQPQHLEFEMTTTINTSQRADDNNTSYGNIRDTKEVHQLDLDEIHVDSSQYQQQTTFDTDQYHLETSVAVLDDHDQLQITFSEVDQSLQQQQQEQQHPPPTASN